MILTKREKLILIGASVAVGLLVLDRLVLEPATEGLQKAQARRNSLRAEMSHTQTLLTLHRHLQPMWRDMAKGGLKNDPAEAESQILHSFREWAEESRVTLSLLKPDRLTEKSRLPVILFQASGNGTMRSIAKLLWKIQTAKIPIKITELQITARKEGTDDLTLQVRISTVYSPEPATATTAPASGLASKPGESL